MEASICLKAISAKFKRTLNQHQDFSRGKQKNRTPKLRQGWRQIMRTCKGCEQ